MEERKIASCAFGSVFQVQHRIGDVVLGRYALKKIPVGNDPQWLETKISEVRALERFQAHPNVVHYHHAWLEWAACADFGPEVFT